MWRVQYGNQYDILGYVYALYGPAWKFTIGTNKQSRGHNGSPVSVVLNRRFLVNRGLACNAKQNTLYTFITNDTMQFFSSRRIYFPTSFHHLGAKRFFFALIYSSIEFRRVRNLLEFTLLFPPHYRFLSPSSSENNNDIENKLPPNLKSVIRRKPERGSVYTRKRAIRETGEKSGIGSGSISVVDHGRSWLTRHDFSSPRSSRRLTRDACHRVHEFRLSPSERIISFHSHELSQFPADSRLLERRIPGSGPRQTRQRARICIFIPASWACRLKLRSWWPPRYLQPGACYYFKRW